MRLPVLVTCAILALLSTVSATPCIPQTGPSSSHLEGIRAEMEYNVTATSGGVFPFTKDHSGCAGSPKASCSNQWKGGPFKQMCPELCDQSNVDPMLGIATATPSGTGPFPLFIYFPATMECNREPGPVQTLKLMAMRGFVSASIEYPQGQSYCPYNFDAKAKAVASGAASPFGMLCALPQVDCSLGIATAGYSQGGQLAMLVSKYEPRVTASFVIAGGPIPDRVQCTTVMGMPFTGSMSLRNAVNSDLADLSYLPRNKRRSIIVDLDLDNLDHTGTANIAVALQRQKDATGYDCGDEYACFQSDGSGYFIMNHADLPPLPAWFAQYGMGWHNAIVEYETTGGEWQSWFLNGTQPWTMNHNLNWLASTAKVEGGGQTSTSMAAPTSKSAAAVAKSISIDLTVAGLNYTKFAANQTAVDKMTADMTSKVLAELPSGYTADHVAISYSAGSIKVTVIITPLANSDTTTLKNLVASKKDVMATAASSIAKSLPGVDSLLESGKSITSIIATASEPTEVTTPSGGTPTQTTSEAPAASANKALSASFMTLSAVALASMFP